MGDYQRPASDIARLFEWTRPFRGDSLADELPWQTRYFADLTCEHACFVNSLAEDGLGKVGRLSRGNADAWSSAVQGASVVASVNTLATVTGCLDLVDGPAAIHYRAAVDELLPGASSALLDGRIGFQQLSELLKECADEQRVKLKHDPEPFLIGQAYAVTTSLNESDSNLFKPILIYVHEAGDAAKTGTVAEAGVTPSTPGHPPTQDEREEVWVAPRIASEPPTQDQAGVVESLRQLKALYDEGILTEAEYEAKRQALVGRL
jgi:hypothetical protein